MIAEKYFEFRARLGTALFSLSRLAQDAGIAMPRVPLLQNLITNLKEPFVFVVVGEVNTGKSTFLNALFGEAFSDVGVVPTTDKVHCFKHGEKHEKIQITDTLEEILCPNEFLKDFNIVDTPGTNCIEGEHQEITERFVPIADLVIFVFSVANPWGATTWEFLERVHKSWFKNVIFVLQQTDLRTPAEVKTIMEHMHETAKKRLGRSFPIFPVSGKQAFLSKTKGVGKEKLYQASGFGELEKYIGHIVSTSGHRMEKLKNIVQTAEVVLDEVGERMSGAETTLGADEVMLQGLDRAVYEQRERTRSKFQPVLHGLDHKYQQMQEEGRGFLQKQLGFVGTIKSLFGKSEVPEKLERRVIVRMIEESRSTLSGAADIVEDDLNHLWKHLSRSAEDQFGVQLHAGPGGDPDWTAQRTDLMSQMEVAVRKFVTDLDLRQDINKQMRRRKAILGTLGTFSALFLVGAAWMFTASAMPWALIPVACAVLLALGAAGYAASSTAGMGRLVDRTIDESREPLRQRLLQALDIQVNTYYTDFLRIFEPVRKAYVERRDQVAPGLDQLSELRLSFGEFDEQLNTEETQELQKRHAVKAAQGDDPARSVAASSAA